MDPQRQERDPNEEEPWFEEGLRFKCTGCGKCCTGASASVNLSRSDLDRLAAFKRIPAGRFVRIYTRLAKGRRVLTNRPGSGDCVFLENNACSVYEARPIQCRTFPFWPEIVRDRESWEATSRLCEGIEHPAGTVIPMEEILELRRIERGNEAEMGRNGR